MAGSRRTTGRSGLSGLSGVPRTLGIAAVVLALLAITIALLPDQDRRRLTVDFPRTVSLYEGSDVRVLGVKVGEVETVTPAGTTVEVELWYDDEYDVPADARAVIVSPAVVGDRFVQLTPAYTGGAEIEDGARLDQTETAVPVELDQIYQSIDDLSVALGPRGANSEGAFSRLVNASAANLRGNGDRFRQMIRDLSLFTGTLSNNKEELFGSLRQVSRFVHALYANDAAVRGFNDSLAEVAGVLAGERRQLALTLETLGGALSDVEGFVQRNEELLADNVQGLVRVTKVLVDQRDALAEALEVAPTALGNLALAYNTRTGTLDQRSNFGENLEIAEEDPALLLCTLLNEDEQDELCGVLTEILSDDGAPELPLPRAEPFAGGRDHGDRRRVEVENVDLTLGGLVEAPR